MLNNTLVFLGYLIKDPVPQHHAVSHCIRFCDHCQLLPGPALRGLKGKADNPFNAHPGEDGDLSSYRVRGVVVRNATLSGVLSFAVLSDDHPIEIFWLLETLGKRRSSSGEDPRWADVDILIVVLSNWKNQAPKRDVIGNIGPSNCTEAKELS